MSLCFEMHPELLGDDPRVSDDFLAASDIVFMLESLGEHSEAAQLLSQNLEFLSGFAEKIIRSTASTRCKFTR